MTCLGYRQLLKCLTQVLLTGGLARSESVMNSGIHGRLD